MAIFRLDMKSDEKLYIIWYITYMSVVLNGGRDLVPHLHLHLHKGRNM